ncbi:MAG: TIGR04283 family arsenosugar biosynthesis glycosyltransferase [Anaerolineae bacterium]|nr:TIGR04283 family arsenosugar biosynthesis glycosyltransferase [Anaerolineae bacterium]
MLVSVIIPTLNEAKNILKTIQAARRDYTPEQVEIVVVDGGSTDDTPGLIPPGVTLIRSPRGRAVQMNAGARGSHGELLAFCHADSQLPAGWREAIIDSLGHPGVSGGCFQTLLSPPKGILHLVNAIRFPADWRIMFGDLVQFMSRATFDQIGGFAEIVLMEDVEMMRTLHLVGRLVRPDLRVITSSRRFVERGPLRQWLLSFWCMIRYLYLGATPEDIARVYVSSREKACR